MSSGPAPACAARLWGGGWRHWDCREKKSTRAAEQDRPDVAEARDHWFEELIAACEGDLTRLIYLDEFGVQTNMARTHGRALVGHRCVCDLPAGHWKQLTITHAIRLGEVTAAVSSDAPTNGEFFRLYAQQVLASQLRPGDVVVMDNLSSHKAAGVAEAIEAAGARLMYLPPYSPDFNPIEMIISKVKRLIRTAAARTVETLHEAISHALAAITATDIAGCFRHAHRLAAATRNAAQL